MTDDIFAARDRLLQTQMAVMDWKAKARDAQAIGGFAALTRELDKWEYGDICDTADSAAIAYWELTRGRKWPA